MFQVHRPPPSLHEGEIITTSMTDAESSSQCLHKGEKHQVFMEIRNCLDIVEPIEGKHLDEVVERVKSATTSLRRILLSPLFSNLYSDNASVDMMDEDAISNLSKRVKLSLAVWDFILLATSSLPAVFGIFDTVIEDRFDVQHGSDEWYEALDRHFEWLRQYRISPYFCGWGGSMRLLTYTSPWPADHPKSDKYFSDSRLAAYAVPYKAISSEWVLGNRKDMVKDILAELQPENGEAIFTEDFWPLLWKNFIDFQRP